MDLHEQRIKRPGITQLINRIYIPKFNVKRFSPYIYSGENKDNYHNYHKHQEYNEEDLGRKPKGKQKKRLILGVETSFDDTCSAVVSSCGQVLSNEKARFLVESGAGENATIRAAAHHE